MALALDGQATGSNSNSTTCTVTLTTSDSNDIIVLGVFSETFGHGYPTQANVSSISGGGLTWNKRAATGNASTLNGGTADGDAMEVWWAYAASPLATVTITVTFDSTIDDASITAFGVNGADTSAPWDTSVNLPGFGLQGSASGGNNCLVPMSAPYSTLNANCMLLTFFGAISEANNSSALSGWTNINTQNNNGGHLASSISAYYNTVSSQQSNQTAYSTITQPGLGNGITIVDAIVEASPSPGSATVAIDGFAQFAHARLDETVMPAWLSTSNADDTICAIICYQSAGGASSITGIADAASLSWSKYDTYNAGSQGGNTYYIDVWTATASAPLSNDEISITFNAENTGEVIVYAFGVANTSGIDADSPFHGSGSSSDPSVGSISTAKAKSVLVVAANAGYAPQAITWSGLQNLGGANGGGPNYVATGFAIEGFSSTQSGYSTGSAANSQSDWDATALAFDYSAPGVTGTWASTEADDTLSGEGSLEGPPTGTWNSTEAHDTWAATGFPELPNGSWFVTEPTDTASIHGYTGTPPVITNYVTGGAADSGGSGITSANVTLSTPVAGELIVVQVTTGGYSHHGFPAESPVPISDTAGLTWHLRSSFTPPADPDFDEPSQINCQVWWAEAPAALTSDVITVETASATGFIAITAIAIVGGVGFDGNADLPDEVDNGGSGEPNVTVSTSGTTRSLLLAFYFSNGGAALQETSVNAPLTGLISGTLESEHDGWEVATNIGYGSITSALSSESFQPFNDSAGHFNGRAVIIDCINGPLTGTFTTTDTKDTMSVHGGLVGGHWTSTEPHDRMDFAPYTGEYGYWDSTETPDAMAFSGGLLQTFWDPSFTSDGVDLQSLDLTIVNQEAFNLPVGSRSNTSHSTGKFYAEFGMWVLSNQSGVGIGNASAVPASWGGIAGNSPGPASNGAGIFQNENGTIWVDEVQQTNSYDLALQGGVIVSVAVDLNANLIWFRQNGNYWNGIAGANPATGAGGYDISGIAGGLIYLFGTVYGQQDKIIMNPGSSAFTYGVPSGFIAWDSAPPLNPPLTLDGYASAGINETGGRIGNPGFDTGTVTLSTSLPNDVIVLGVAMGGYYNADTVDTVTSTSGLTWKRRHQRWQFGGYKSGGSTTVNQGLDIEIWWAHAPTALTNEVITVTSGGQNVGGMALIAFGVNGANYTTPWDTHSQAGGYVENGGEIFYFPGQAQLSTKANSTFLFGIHGDTQADAGVAQAPWTYVTSAEGFEVDGDSSFASFLYQVVEEPQFAIDVLVGQIYAGGPTYLANSVMFDSIVSAGETGTDQEIVWFWDANSVNGILQLTTGNSLTLGYSATNFNLMVLIQVMIQSASGNGEVASISEGQGSLSSAGFQRRSRKTTVTESGNLAVEIWWGWMPMHTAAERVNNDTIIINTVNTTSGDIIGATMWGLGGSTGAFGLGDPFWDINPSVPAENASDGSSPPPYATNISTTIPSDLLVAWTGNLNENVPGFTDPYVTLLQDYPFTVQPIFPLNSNAPPFYTGFEFFYSPGLVTDETAEFLNGSPEPAGWIVIADAIPVGPPQPPTGVLDTTDSQDKFTHNGNFTAIGIANTVGWVGYPACYGTIATTDHEDINGGTPNLGYSPFLGEGWLGWVPAFAAWHSTDHDDSDSFYGWIINTRCTGQLVGVETVDRWASSEHALGPVSGSWHSTEHKDYWSSSGFEIPKVHPPAPIKRRLLIIT